MSSRLAVADDALFDEHRGPPGHPERPERLGAARRAVTQVASEGAELVRVAPRDATEAEVTRAHDPAYVEALVKLAGKHASIDADTFVSPGSVAAALRAAGGAIALVDAIVQGGPSRGVALLRPPGHHATRREGMGFCLVNNIAVAALSALASGLSRVAIVDFDVHHGNGTEDIFAEDPRVLFVSLHQFPLYPGTGAAEETGRGEGEGYNVNIPLSAGATDATYRAAFAEVVVPVVARFEPELVLVSAGYDAHERDPLAAMKVTERGYAAMVGELVKLADASARGRIALLLEGGYDLDALEGSLAASLRVAVGLSGVAPSPEEAVLPRHRAEIDEARRITSRRWPGL